MNHSELCSVFVFYFSIGVLEEVHFSWPSNIWVNLSLMLKSFLTHLVSVLPWEAIVCMLFTSDCNTVLTQHSESERFALSSCTLKEYSLCGLWTKPGSTYFSLNLFINTYILKLILFHRFYSWWIIQNYIFI